LWIELTTRIATGSTPGPWYYVFFAALAILIWARWFVDEKRPRKSRE
jgi:hypothetical protein